MKITFGGFGLRDGVAINAVTKRREIISKIHFKMGYTISRKQPRTR